MINKFSPITITIFLIIALAGNLYANKRINLFTGKELPVTSTVNQTSTVTDSSLPVTSTVNQTFTVTTEPKELKLAEAKSSFNCETGEIKIDAQIIEDLNKMFQTFGSDAESAVKQMVKEMATQAGIELTLEVLARLHYTVVNGLSSGSDVLIALKTSAVTKCFTSGFFNALESELEGGLGTNIYDILSGRVGINFVSIAGIYPCVKKVLGEPKDEEAKKRLNKSRQWVRFFFYKLLTQSFDSLFNLQLSAGEMDPKCRELRSRIQKNDLQVSLAQLGNIVSPTGTLMNSHIDVAEPTKVAERIPDPKESSAKDIAKEDADKASGTTTETEAKVEAAEAEKATVDADASLTDEEKTSKKKALELKKAMARKYIEEVPITTTIVINEAKDIIDRTDLKPAEIKAFNKSIYDKIVYIMERSDSPYTKNIEGSFFKILKKIFTITTYDEVMKNKRKKIFEAKDTTTTPESFLYDSSSTKEEILRTDYYGELKKKALYYSNARYGLLTQREKREIELQVMQTIPNKNVNYKDLIAMGYYKRILKKMEDWNLDVNYIASGEYLFTNGGSETQVTESQEIDDIIYNEFQHDLNEFRGAGAGNPDPSITKRVNKNIVLKKPLHELEYLRILYEAESREVLLQLIGSQPGEQLGNMTISFMSDVNDANNEAIVDYTIPKIRLIKEMYAIELLDIYAKRAEAINFWALKYYQNPNITMNDSLMKFLETEVEKFKYKLKQKRLMIKLMLEKDVK